ncbi:MAG TPA: heparinase II/III family protein, partial [Tepidisphaeraceae bacterium]|nr:heparinase II/III family protein [Tepidisphaeraceae bacterium]
FFLAKATGQSELAAPTLALLKKLEQHVETVRKEGAVRVWLMPLALVWPAPPAVEGDASRLPRAWTGAGRTPLALLREYGDDGQVAFAGIKGGWPSVSHAHMDIGSFVIDLDGVRWAMDLGAEEYARIEAAMPGLWDMHQESPRWQLLRYHNLQHNTLTIDGQLQRVDGRANTIRVGDAKWPFATIDLSPVYRGQAKRVDRGIRLPDA